MKKGFWNYRVVKIKNGFSINEVIYDHQGNLEFVEKEPLKISYESFEDLKSAVELFTLCLREPVVNEEF